MWQPNLHLDYGCLYIPISIIFKLDFTVIHWHRKFQDFDNELQLIANDDLAIIHYAIIFNHWEIAFTFINLIRWDLSLKIEEISKKFRQEKKSSMIILQHTGWYGIITVLEYIPWFRRGRVENISLSWLSRLASLICRDHMPSVVGRDVPHCYPAYGLAFDWDCNQACDRLVCDSISLLLLSCI